jgi:hypothetical protein
MQSSIDVTVRSQTKPTLLRQHLKRSQMRSVHGSLFKVGWGVSQVLNPNDS